MSAYALPGLFPPIDSQTKDGCAVEDSSANKEEKKKSAKSESSSVGNVQQSNVPLHHVSSNDDIDDDFNYSSSRNDDNNIGCLLLNSAVIAVKEAKIDPVRWIQYVTGSNPQHYAHQIGKTLRRRVSNSINCGGVRSPQVSPASVDNINTTTTTRSGSNSKKSKNKSPQNEAIEFELSITFNGRKYTAKRTMQCIMQLRDDLIREMKHRTIGNHYYGNKIINTTHSYFNTKLPSKNNNRINRKNATAEKVDADVDENEFGVQIPEIPPLTVDEERSFVGRGFTMLHAMVTSYVPVMEGWLKNVMAIVPQDSECLINFLWEPTVEITAASCKSVLDSINSSSSSSSSSNNINSHNFASGKKFKSSTSLTTLGSIKEIDYDTEDD